MFHYILLVRYFGFNRFSNMNSSEFNPEFKRLPSIKLEHSNIPYKI